jgi:MFS family permease
MAAAGAVALAAFVVRERTARSPMLPLSIFAERQFAATNAVTLLLYAALSGTLLLLPTQLQVGWGYSPLASGLATLPITVIMFALSGRSGRLAARIGPRLQMSAGPVVVAIGLALLTRSTDGASYVAYVLPAVVVFAIGLAATVAPLTATAMGSAPPEHAGLASAVNNDVARFGGLLATAVLPPLAGITGTAYLHPAQLAAGFRTAVWIAAGLAALGGILAAITIRNRPRAAPPGIRETGTGETGTVAETGAPEAAETAECLHCGLDAPPLRD